MRSIPAVRSDGYGPYDLRDANICQHTLSIKHKTHMDTTSLREPMLIMSCFCYVVRLMGDARSLRPLSTFIDKPLYLTFPPQNWHSSPCQPSAQTQVPFPQTPPFMQVMSVHLTSVAVAATKTHTHTIAVSVQQAVEVQPFRAHFCRYFTLNRHKNIWKNSLNILVREPFFLRVVCGAFFQTLN